MRAARGEEKGVSGRRWSMTTTAWVDAGAAVQPLPARTQTAAVRTHGVLRRDAGARALRRSAAAALQRSVHACGTEVLFPMPTRRAGPLLARLPPPALRCETVLLAKQPRVRLQEDREAAALAGSTGALEPSGAAAAARAPGAPRAGGRRADVAGAVALKRGGKADYRAPWWTTDCKMAAP